MNRSEWVSIILVGLWMIVVTFWVVVKWHEGPCDCPRPMNVHQASEYLGTPVMEYPGTVIANQVQEREVCLRVRGQIQ
jgi:hypothetical protein